MNSIDDFNEGETKEKIREFLDEERLQHTLNTLDLALKLASGKGIKGIDSNE